MPRGPKGEYRPRDSVQGAILSLRIALGEITEEEARKLAPKKPKKRSGKKRQTASS